MPMHKVIGGLTFTIDNILIHKVSLGNLADGTTIENVKSHFQRYGRILDAYLLEDVSRCIIEFADPRDAARLLRFRPVFMGRQEIYVCACDGFDQPIGQSLISSIRNVSKTNEQRSAADNNRDQAYILNLNDDCLKLICGMLKPSEQIYFALTCKRFYNIMVEKSKVVYRYFNTAIFQCWSLFKIRIFLQIVGPQVKVMLLDKLHEDHDYPSNRRISLLGMFCYNVERLKIQRWCYQPRSICTLIEGMHMLQDLELYYCDIDEQLFDVLKTLKNLQSLNMTCCRAYEEKIKLFGLEKLILFECTGINSEIFSRMCMGLGNLSYLDIRRCSFLVRQDYATILRHLKQLETLKITSGKGFNCLVNLPNLKQLKINQYDRDNGHAHKFLSDLANTNPLQLEELMLSGKLKMGPSTAKAIARLKNLKLVFCNVIGVTSQVLTILAQLSNLEVISLSGTSAFSHTIADNRLGVLQIFEHCRKLKRLTLYRTTYPETFERNILKILKRQHDQGIRGESVYMQYMGDHVKNIEEQTMLKIISWPHEDYFVESDDELVKPGEDNAMDISSSCDEDDCVEIIVSEE